MEDNIIQIEDYYIKKYRKILFFFKLSYFNCGSSSIIG